MEIIRFFRIAGGSVAFPLLVWFFIVFAIFCLTMCGAVGRCRWKSLRKARFVFGSSLLLAWMTHSFFILDVCLRIYRIGWATNWSPGSAPTTRDLVNAAIVSLVIGLAASSLLLCASVLASWDVRQHPPHSNSTR